MLVNQYRYLGLALSVLMLCLTACDRRTEYIAGEIKKIKEAPALPVEDSPVAGQTAMYSYSAQNYRSPFMPPSLALDISRMAGRVVMPDLYRPKQELELIPLEQLTMKGSITKPGAPIYGLIQTPDGKIARVQVGNYLGQNYGRIVQITDKQIDVMEIVQNGVDGWVERPRSLIMAGAPVK